MGNRLTAIRAQSRRTGRAGAGESPAELSREFGCSAQTIANWVGQDAIDRGKPLPGRDGLTTAEREELVQLRRSLTWDQGAEMSQPPRLRIDRE